MRLAVLGLALLPLSVFAAGSDVVGENLLWLAVILLAARLFAPLAQKIGFPAVLGELLLGVVLGNLGLLGFHYFDTIARDPIIMFMAELGVIILLLQIGLETRLGDLVSVGMRASASLSPSSLAPSSPARWCCRAWNSTPICSLAQRWRRPRSASLAASSATSAS
jgi:hypothetical protein